jgi:carboxyl-terminal processing protease
VVEDPTDTLTRVREADLQRHLENGRQQQEKKEPAVTRTKPVPTPSETKPVELGSKDDFQLSQALAFLKGEPVKSQSPTVAQTDTQKQQVKPSN